MSITIAEYDPLWPVQFRDVERELRRIVGELAVAVEHVGSTAVPGLAAKPIIDVIVVIESQDSLSDVIDRLAVAEYQHQGDLGIVDRHAFKAPPGAPQRHVYVCPRSATALREQLAFRDFLRTNPRVAQAYAALKRDIAATCNGDRTMYSYHKTPFVRDVLSRARVGNANPAAE